MLISIHYEKNRGFATQPKNTTLVALDELHWLQRCKSLYMVIVYDDKNTCKLSAIAL
jgi:hypothetical protein